MPLPISGRSMPPDEHDFERDHVGVDTAKRRDRRLVGLHRREQALLRRVAPAGVAPHLGLGAQAAHRDVEHLHHEIGRQHVVADALGGEQVDLRLLDLDRGTAGSGKLGKLGVQRLRDGEDRRPQILVVEVAAAHPEKLGGDGAELHRLRGLALRRLPDVGVLQGAAPDRPHQVGHHAGLQHVVHDVAARRDEAGPPAFHAVRLRRAEALHVARRVGEPAMSAHVGVEMRVAVGGDVEPRRLLLGEIHRHRVEILLAER